MPRKKKPKKAIWQMTLTEYLVSCGNDDRTVKRILKNKIVGSVRIKAKHKIAVYNALKDKLPVRSKVLRDYPQFKKKSRRKKKVKPSPTGRGIYNNLGGYMINPPEDCPNRKKADDGGIWVDLLCCQSQFCDLHPCDRIEWFRKATPEERQAEWYKCGVKQKVFYSKKEIAELEEKRNPKKEKEK